MAELFSSICTVPLFALFPCPHTPCVHLHIVLPQCIFPDSTCQSEQASFVRSAPGTLPITGDGGPSLPSLLPQGHALGKQCLLREMLNPFHLILDLYWIWQYWSSSCFYDTLLKKGALGNDFKCFYLFWWENLVQIADTYSWQTEK